MADPSAAPLDRATIDELLAATGGDRAFLAELIDAFIADGPLQVAAMRDALAIDGLDPASAASALVRPTHTLKSSAATFGAIELTERCRALEARARTGSLDDATAAVDGIDGALAVVVEGLVALRNNGSAG